MMMTRIMKNYPIDQSPLYKLHSKRKLENILCTNLDIEKMANYEGKNFKFFYITQGNKKRKVESPIPEIQELHRKIARLLCRIDPPDYLYSATKKRSYLSNAQRHIGRHALIKVDISKFFPSVSRLKVYNFFRFKMKCSPDVSAIIAKLLTVDGHLATGSSASPILSYYANIDMFEELYLLAKNRSATMTCYIDDVCFSGEHVSKKLLYEVQKIIRRHGYVNHKQKARYYSPGEVKLITGVAVTSLGVRLPLRRHRAIRDGYTHIFTAKTDSDRLTQLEKQVGRLFEASQIDPSFKDKAKRASQARANLKRRLLSKAFHPSSP